MIDFLCVSNRNNGTLSDLKATVLMIIGTVGPRIPIMQTITVMMIVLLEQGVCSIRTLCHSCVFY